MSGVRIRRHRFPAKFCQCLCH